MSSMLLCCRLNLCDQEFCQGLPVTSLLAIVLLGSVLENCDFWPFEVFKDVGFNHHIIKVRGAAGKLSIRLTANHPPQLYFAPRGSLQDAMSCRGLLMLLGEGKGALHTGGNCPA